MMVKCTQCPEKTYVPKKYNIKETICHKCAMKIQDEVLNNMSDKEKKKLGIEWIK